jgi:hypothetical protein
MVSSIETLRESGIQHLMIGAIKLYQETLSKVLPSRCRFIPSCSQFGIEAISIHGIIPGIKLTYERIKRCKRPNRGFDPVPAVLFAKTKNGSPLSRERVQSTLYDKLAERDLGLVPKYKHKFKLIVTYPKDREFYDQDDLKKKIALFNRQVLKVAQYSLLFTVDTVE